MDEFDPNRARTARPLPLWVDAFVADTMELQADEVGAYNLILWAMWMRPTCDFPDDVRKLATVCRVSTRTFNSRIGPAILPFFRRKNGVIFSRRLQKEAFIVAKFVAHQHARKAGINPDNVLKTINPPLTTDTTTDEPRTHPRTHPTYNLHKKTTSSNILSKLPGNDELFGEPKKPPEKPDEVKRAFDRYNDLAAAVGLPKARVLTDQRRKAIRARLSEIDGLEGWEDVLKSVARSPHLKGDNDRGWTADLDFIVTKSKFVRIIEGAYHGRDQQNGNNGTVGQARRRDPHAQQMEALAQVAAQGRSGMSGTSEDD